MESFAKRSPLHPRPYQVVPLGPEHRQEVLRLDHAAFAIVEDPGLVLDFFEWDRTFGVWDDSELIGVNTTFSLQLTMPSASPGVSALTGTAARSTPLAGLSWVGVHPGYRRRGVLSAMIGHHLHHLHQQQSEPISGLHASEPSIYGRFGYGLATTGLKLTIPRAAKLRQLRAGVGIENGSERIDGSDEVSVRFVRADPQQHTELIAQLYRQACLARPGMIDRPLAITRAELRDTPRTLERQEPLHLLIAERAATPTGYVLLRRTMTWTDSRQDGSTAILEFAATDPLTAHRLWQTAIDFDLTSHTTTHWICEDDPLLTWLTDHRAAIPTHSDRLWLRLVDVDRALTARHYASDVDAVIAVTDELCPWNARRWRLTAGPTGSACQPTTDSADVLLDVRELAAVLLGRVTFRSLALAGLIQAAPGSSPALGQLSTAFVTDLAPGGIYGF